LHIGIYAIARSFALLVLSEDKIEMNTRLLDST